MAKLRGAKKAAFLRRMARGRAKTRKYGARGRKRTAAELGRQRAFMRARRSTPRRRNGLNSYNPSTVRRRRPRVRRLSFRRRRNPTAVIANPGFFSSMFGKGRRKKRKGTTMAKRRRKRRASARRAAPRRRRVRRRNPRVRRRRRRNPSRLSAVRSRRRRRRNPRVRRHRFGRRRRNPGMGGLLKATFVPYAVGFVTAGAMAVVDTGLAAYPMTKNIAKVGVALALAATVGKRHPIVATAAISAIAASQGYSFGTTLAGGMLAQSPAQAVKGLGDMSRTYPELGALLNGGLGALLNGPPDMDSVVTNYATALNNMADEDD